MLVARKVALRRSGGAQVSVILVNDLGSLDHITCALLAGLDVRDLVWLTAQSPGCPPSPPQPPPPTVGAFGCGTHGHSGSPRYRVSVAHGGQCCTPAGPYASLLFFLPASLIRNC
ncbi:hypothetical protein DFH09DRAFT_1275535 [Mycena vulgaris]|nr:hypothetical protein DFH09DRAFT_1275535 [Mycena vulgaris]